MVKYLFYELGKTDKEIADIFNVTRSTITKYRKCHGIKTPITTGRIGELKALFKLTDLGFDVVDMNDESKLAEYDLLINDEIRIEVKTSKLLKGNRFNFALSERPENGNIASKNRRILECGRTKKIYRNKADYFIFVGLEGEKTSFWIIPTNEVDENKSGISFSKNNKRYAKYKNEFDIIDSEVLEEIK
ncbi:hypothetical protein [Staphylococcus gallinarum]|uniref:hypothetical protein n=1 Tax=Staphylococcus gallinarum TaxID=1293 RepID=UPI003F562AE6